MKVQVSDHQHKSVELIAALMLNGVEIVRENADILLIDCDFTVGHYPKTIEKAYQEGAEIVLYSHGAPVIVVWDSVWEPLSYTRAYLAQSHGQKWVMESYGFPLPIHVIGWHFCDQLPFQPVENVKKVLFAPWHPHGNGWLNPEPMAANQKVYDSLLNKDFELTVRHVRSLDQNGLKEKPGVIYQHSNLSLLDSINAIDDAEVIVTNPGTFACLAVARGKPTLIYAQNIKPHDGFSYETLNYVRHWDEYKDYMYYPHDYDDALITGDIMGSIEQAAKNEASEWREKFIGDPLDPDALINALKGVLEDA